MAMVFPRRQIACFSSGMRTLPFAVVALGAVLVLGAIACGGKDKPPLTPDQENPGLLGPDAGVEMPTTPPPAK